LCRRIEKIKHIFYAASPVPRPGACPRGGCRVGRLRGGGTRGSASALIGAGRKDTERARGQREAYWGLFKAHLDDALVERIREATNGNYALGDRRFQAEIEQALDRPVTKGKAGRPKAQPEPRRGQVGLLWNRGLSPITLQTPSRA
jgi:hypothetical protein